MLALLALVLLIPLAAQEPDSDFDENATYVNVETSPTGNVTSISFRNLTTIVQTRL
jgi:hypothetical protein